MSAVCPMKQCPNAVIWCSRLVQIMAWRRPRRQAIPGILILYIYIIFLINNQSWNIVDWTLENRLQWNLKWNLYIFIQENAFESVVWKMEAILSLPQCVMIGPRLLLLWSEFNPLCITIIWIQLCYIFLGDMRVMWWSLPDDHIAWECQIGHAYLVHFSRSHVCWSPGTKGWLSI